MAICDSTISLSLLGRSVRITTSFAGHHFCHTGEVIAVLLVVPGSGATPALLLDEGSGLCDFHDASEILTFDFL